MAILLLFLILFLVLFILYPPFYIALYSTPFGRLFLVVVLALFAMKSILMAVLFLIVIVVFSLWFQPKPFVPKKPKPTPKTYPKKTPSEIISPTDKPYINYRQDTLYRKTHSPFGLNILTAHNSIQPKPSNAIPFTYDKQSEHVLPYATFSYTPW